MLCGSGTSSRLVGVFILMVFVVGLLGSSCRSSYPPAYEEFLNLPRDQRVDALSKYPPEEQVDRYVWAMLVRHPPQIELADVVAKNGARVLPIVIRRIQEEEAAATQVDLLLVVRRIQEMGEVDVAGDAETMAALEAAVSSMDDPDWKPQAVEILEKLRRARG